MEQGATVQPILSPDAAAMRQHLEHLFGGDLDGAHDGLIELAWTDGSDGRLRHAALYATDELDELVERAVEVNRVPNQNAYIGAALRKPGTFPGARCEDADFYALPAYYVDLDEPGAAERARALYRGCRPTLAVVTGRRPHLRAQLWWRHESPDRDPIHTRAQLAALAEALAADRTVVNPARVMRLAGSIAWPLKPQRELERTELQVFTDDRPRQYCNGELTRAFPVDPLLAAGSSPAPAEPPVASPAAAPPSGSGGALNLQPFAGTSPDELIARIRAGGGQWHNDVLRLVGHWINRGWTDAEILSAAETLTTAGYTAAQTRAEVAVMIRGGRAKWHAPNPRVDLDGGPAAPAEDADEGPFPASALVGEPPARRWIIPDWLPAGEATGLYGDGGVGKTLLAQQIAAAVATGSPFMGMLTTQMPVLAILCEDDRDELHRRQHAINRWLDCAMHPLLNQLGLWPRVGKENFLAVYGREGQHQLTPFYQRLFDLVGRLPAGDKLVILDTLADLFGGNEIVRLQANHFVKAVIGRLVRDCGATVLVLAHPSQAGLQTGAGSSGSTGWNNAFRQRLYLAKADPSEGGGFDRTLSRKKANYASANADDQLKLVWAEGVLNNVASDSKSVSTDRATLILKDIDHRWQSGNPFNPYARSPFYVIPWMTKAHGLSRGEAIALMQAWMSNGLVTLEMVNKDTKRQGLKVVRWPG